MKTLNFKQVANFLRQSEFKSIEDINLFFSVRYNELKHIQSRQEVPQHLVGLSDEQALLKIIGLNAIYYIFIIGLNSAINSYDVQFLHNVIFTYNRIKFNRSLLFESKYDHSENWLYVIELFAGMDLDLVYKAFPEEYGLTNNGNMFCKVCSNILISLLYKNDNWFNRSLNLSKKYLQQKSTQFDKAVINYLLALQEQSVDSINESMSIIAKLYSKSKTIHDYNNPIFKHFGLFLHGLYNIAYYFLPKEVFKKVSLPQTDVFIADLANWQKENNFKVGVPFFAFKNELSKLNEMFL